MRTKKTVSKFVGEYILGKADFIHNFPYGFFFVCAPFPQLPPPPPPPPTRRCSMNCQDADKREETDCKDVDKKCI